MMIAPFRPLFARLPWYAVLAAASLTTAALSGCSRTPTPLPHARSGLAAAHPVVPALQYVGSATCISCHQEEGRKWLGSRHQETLTFVDTRSLGWRSPPTGVVPGAGSTFSLALRGIHYQVHENGSPRRFLPLTMALGSGKTCMTYVSVVGNQVIEFRQSWYPTLKKWFETPVPEAVDPSLPGKMYPPDRSRACILCHAVALPGASPVPRPDLLGVGCERCHGPGSAHVAAVTSVGSGPMPDLGRWTPTRLDNMCGTCHRTVRDVELGDVPAAATNRFQPFGLSLSRCFRESGGRLSCVTCHDPHTSVSTDTRRYEQICLSCHTSHPVSPSDAAALPSRRFLASLRASAGPIGKPCPVNPTTGCVSCHMPTRAAINGSPLPISMADHWIRIFKAHSP